MLGLNKDRLNGKFELALRFPIITNKTLWREYVSNVERYTNYIEDNAKNIMKNHYIPQSR